MKKLSVLIIFLLAFALKSSAQRFDATEFKKNLGKRATLCDTIRSLRIVSDTLTLLNMGGIFPNQKYTVVIRGNKINLDWVNLKGKAACVTGVFEMYKDQPQIAVAQPDFIQVH